MTARHPNGFRFSDEFINRWTRLLVIALFVITGAGIALGVASDADGAPGWLGAAAAVVLVLGIAGPIIASAVLGGEAIRRGGGVIGALFAVGLLAGASGAALEIPWLMWGGGIVLALGIVGFWVIGWIAKVPMYIGLHGAHGKVIQREDDRPEDLFEGTTPACGSSARGEGAATRAEEAASPPCGDRRVADAWKRLLLTDQTTAAASREGQRGPS